MSYTPGPWKVSDSPVVMTDGSRFENLKTWRKNVRAGVYIVSQCLVHERSIGNADKYKSECEANAKLIAAAPDLLEALQLAKKEIKACYQLLDIDNKDRGYGQGGVLSKADAAIEKAKGL